MKRTTLFAAGLAALAMAAPASAQVWRGDASRGSYDSRYSYTQARQVAYDNGYREGFKEGQKERRDRDRYDYRDERTYQRGDKGYHREYGDRGRYQQMFRAGYADGYAEAYRRLGYGRPGVGVGRRDDRWGRGPGYGSGGGYGNGGGYGYGYDFAFQNGVRDGYEKGQEDARKRRSHDVLRHKWYRSGDRHYENRYGSRQQYADIYRQGFRQGYERGYRERW